MKKIIFLSIMLFFKNINCLDDTSLELLPRDIRDHVLLPLLLQLKNEPETTKNFLSRIEKQEDVDLEQEKDNILRRIPSTFSFLKFDTGLCKASSDFQYVGVVGKKDRDHDILKIYQPFKGKTVIYQISFVRNICQDFILSNEGLCIICKELKNDYEVVVINPFLNSHSSLKKFAKHQNTDFAKTNKPRLFFNKQQSMLGVQLKIPYKKVAWVGLPAPKKDHYDSKIDLIDLKTNNFIERMSRLPFWKSYEEKKDKKKMEESSLNLHDPKAIPQTLDELFRKVGICKKIDQSGAPQ